MSVSVNLRIGLADAIKRDTKSQTACGKDPSVQMRDAQRSIGRPHLGMYLVVKAKKAL